VIINQCPRGVEGTNECPITLRNGPQFHGKGGWGVIPLTDIAVVKVVADGPAVAPWAIPQGCGPGEWAIANPATPSELDKHGDGRDISATDRKPKCDWRR